MNRSLALIVALLVSAPSLPADNAAMEKHLARALKLYPDADADKNGVLSQDGALNRLLQQLAWEAVTHYPLSGVKADAWKTATQR